MPKSRLLRQTAAEQQPRDTAAYLNLTIENLSYSYSLELIAYNPVSARLLGPLPQPFFSVNKEYNKKTI